MSIHPHDDLAAYALGALDRAEEQAVRAHLAACEVCRTEARALAETAWTIAETAERTPPASLRAAIVGRAGRERVAGARGTPLASLAAALRRPTPLVVPLALAALLVAALLGYGSVRGDANRYADALAGVASGRVVALAPTGERNDVRGSLVLPANGGRPYLILELPAPPAGKTWEAWVLRGERPVAAGISDARGVTILVLTERLAAGDGVAITLEPAGGVSAVTGRLILVGKT